MQIKRPPHPPRAHSPFRPLVCIRHACECVQAQHRDASMCAPSGLDSCVCIRKVICKYYPCLALSMSRLRMLFVLCANSRGFAPKKWSTTVLCQREKYIKTNPLSDDVSIRNSGDLGLFIFLLWRRWLQCLSFIQFILSSKHIGIFCYQIHKNNTKSLT
jgi:hypothetical protein